MINALSNVLAISSVEPSGGGSKPPGADEALHEKVTSVACEVLRVYHGLIEFQIIYKDTNLISEITENAHENTPHFSKLQNGFNSLKDRVRVLGVADPRISTLFAQMVEITKNKYSVQNKIDLSNLVYGLIGEKKIIKKNPFAVLGIVCVKDDLVNFLKPKNVVFSLKNS